MRVFLLAPSVKVFMFGAIENQSLIDTPHIQNSKVCCKTILGRTLTDVHKFRLLLFNAWCYSLPSNEDVHPLCKDFFGEMDMIQSDGMR
jgi:hypothetical protein